jgi:glycerol-3-phosphate O-acyltransferase
VYLRGSPEITELFDQLYFSTSLTDMRSRELVEEIRAARLQLARDTYRRIIETAITRELALLEHTIDRATEIELRIRRQLYDDNTLSD